MRIPSHSVHDKNREFVLLDGLRGIAAICIVVRHVPFFFSEIAPMSFLAVDFFFALSGFVLAHAYWDRLRSGMSARHFLLLRIIRLYVLYFIGVLIWLPIGVRMIIIGSTDRLSSAVDLTTALLFLPSPLSEPAAFEGALYPINFPAWSLFFELIANFGLALIALKANRAFLFLMVFCAAVLFSIATMAAGGPLGGGIDWPTFYIGLIRVSFSFFAGVLLFDLWRSHKAKIRIPSTLIVVTLILTLFSRPSNRIEALGLGLSAPVIFMAIIWFGASSVPGRTAASWCTWLGSISYGVYVLHVPISIWGIKIIEKIFAIPSDAVSWAWGTGFIALVLMAAHFAQRIDYPIRRLLLSYMLTTKC